jgi:hypothetical protein
MADFSFTQQDTLNARDAQRELIRQREVAAQEAALDAARRAQEQSQFTTQFGEGQRQFDLGNTNTLNDFGLRQDEFGFAQEQFGEDTRRFDIGQANRSALLEQLGLATPGGPATDGGAAFGEGTFFGGLLGDGGAPSQGFTDLLNEQRGARDQLLGDLAGFGDSQRAAQQRTFDTAENNIIANLEGRGLGASNLLGAGVSQVAAERNQASLELEDQLLGRRTDLASSLNQGIFDTQAGQLERENQRALQGISTIGQLTGGLV